MFKFINVMNLKDLNLQISNLLDDEAIIMFVETNKQVFYMKGKEITVKSIQEQLSADGLPTLLLLNKNTLFYHAFNSDDAFDNLEANKGSKMYHDSLDYYFVFIVED